MSLKKKTQAQELERDEHMARAIEYATQLVADAQLRGLTGYDVAISIAGVLAARNATLAGKVLIAVGNAIRMQPVTKIVKTSDVRVDLQQLPDGSFGQAN